MAFAITLKASADTRKPLEALWATFAKFETEPSMASLGYPPHLTLAIYDDAPGVSLRTTLRTVFSDISAIRVTFSAVSFFEEPQLVFWAASDPSSLLSEVHQAIHRLVDPRLSHPHYRPDRWVPHVTVAMNVSAENKHAAIARASQPIEPFEILFDTADFLKFLPVRIIEECLLS